MRPPRHRWIKGDRKVVWDQCARCGLERLRPKGSWTTTYRLTNGEELVFPTVPTCSRETTAAAA